MGDSAGADAADERIIAVQVNTLLDRGRAESAVSAWADAFECLAQADRECRLGGADLELMARSAYMLGRDDDYVSALERAHRIYVDEADLPRAVRCAFWIGHSFLFRGERAHAGGWFGRAERLLAEESRACVEHGYLLIPVWLRQMASGDWEGGHATATRAAEIGELFRDADLTWLARDDQARALLRLGRVGEGLRLVDEAFVATTAGELSPIVSGIVYCNTIAFCRDTYQLRHATDWTEALTRWCNQQPAMVAHMGLCLVHRAEVMQLRGAWIDALGEADRAAERFVDGVLNQLSQGRALYAKGEIHRLRGELAEAEDAFRASSRCGFEPQPGLALLRREQGRHEASTAAIRRAVGEAVDPLRRVVLLPAYVEIMLAAGEIARARAARCELAEIAQAHASEALEAMSAQAGGAVALAESRSEDALVQLRTAWGLWSELGAVYESARVRVLIGRACRAVGDEDTATLELAAAADTFDVLDAAPDRARVEALLQRAPIADTHGLTPRELEVLRLVAAGRSNREIAEALVISEHTVRRHLQNTFAKLRVGSRTEASAFAYTHHLI